MSSRLVTLGFVAVAFYLVGAKFPQLAAKVGI